MDGEEERRRFCLHVIQRNGASTRSVPDFTFPEDSAAHLFTTSHIGSMAERTVRFCDVLVAQVAADQEGTSSLCPFKSELAEVIQLVSQERISETGVQQNVGVPKPRLWDPDLGTRVASQRANWMRLRDESNQVGSMTTRLFRQVFFCATFCWHISLSFYSLCSLYSICSLHSLSRPSSLSSLLPRFFSIDLSSSLS